MELLFITPSYTLGGVETQSFHLAEHFVRNGHKVTFVCIRGDEGPLYQKLIQIGVDCHFFYPLSDLNKKGLFGKLKIMFSFIRFLRKLKPSIILPFTEPINTIVNVVRPFTGAKKALYTMRGGYIVQGPQLKFKPFFKYSKPIYVSNSQHGAKIQADYLGINVSEFKVIRNGIKMKEPELSGAEWRSKLNLNPDDFVFIMVANYYSEKKHELLLDAWNEFSRTTKNTRLILLGDKSPFDRIYFKAKAQILDTKLYDSVIQINSTQDVSGLLSACNCGVLLTESEGCPNSVLEYMSAEIPVIGSKIPAIQEVLGNNYPYLVNNEDLNTVIKALNNVYQAKNLDSLIAHNKEIIQNSYDYNKLLNDYDLIFQ